MRAVLIGAFPFPYPQGSQVFAAQQAAGLVRAGDEVAVASYGRGRGALPQGVDWIPAPEALAPRSGRSGPSPTKPLADLALAATVVRAQRARRFDVAIAHNAEAALVASVVRRVTGLPFVYVAHTLLEQELSAYASPRWRGALDRIGGAIDRRVTRTADAVIVLCEAARAVLEPHARSGLVRIVPPHEILDPPGAGACARACREAGVEPGGFFLYTGNLDGYQELERLAEAARRLGPDDPPVVVATHDASGADAFPGLRVVETDFATARSLAFAAIALVLTRTRTGGFPIKLLNYMETRRPIVAFAEVAEGLRHDETAWLLAKGASARELAHALLGLARDPDRSTRLGEAAFRHLRERHDPATVTDATQAVLRRLAGRLPPGLG